LQWNHILDYYYQKGEYSNLLIITGASNGATIKTAMNFNAKLVGITEIINICGVVFRKELYLNKKEKVWV
jgi:hypothetical protein